MSLITTANKTPFKGNITKHQASEDVSYNNGTYTYNLSNGGIYVMLTDKIKTTSFDANGRNLVRVNMSSLNGNSGIVSITATVTGFVGTGSGVLVNRQDIPSIVFTQGATGTPPTSGTLNSTANFPTVSSYNQNTGAGGSFTFGLQRPDINNMYLTLYFQYYTANVDVIVSLEIRASGFANTNAILSYSIQNSL